MVSLRATLAAASTALMARAAAQCTSSLSVTNGGFESGSVAPWYVPAPQPDQPVTSVVTPGYKSNHALQLAVAPANFTDFSLVHPPIGEQCKGSQYKVSFALNWGSYAGPPSDGSIGCSVFVQSSYCFGAVVGADQIYAVPGAGWKAYSYTCEAESTGQATYTVDFSCFGNATYDVPGFDFQMDALNIVPL